MDSQVLTTAIEQGGPNAVLFIGGIGFLIYFMRSSILQSKTMHEYQRVREERHEKMISEMMEAKKQSSDRWRTVIEKQTSAHFALADSINKHMGGDGIDRRRQ